MGHWSALSLAAVSARSFHSLSVLGEQRLVYVGPEVQK